MNDKLISSVADYYSNKIEEFGATAKGVDWNGEESQYIRFEQLSKIFTLDTQSSKEVKVADLGCGYGAYFEYLQTLDGELFKYFGYDVSQKMCDTAVQRIGGNSMAEFFCSKDVQHEVDYIVASGIFNVRLQESSEIWQDYFHSTITDMYKKATKGIAFNCLTSYSDAHKMRDYLYYADPCEVFNFCKNELSKEVSLIHDYELYEFTILVRK